MQRAGGAARPRLSHAAVSEWDRRIVRFLLEAVGSPPLKVILWDGKEVGGLSGETIARMWVRDRRTLLKLLVDPSFQFGEAYSSGAVVVDGDLVGLLASLERSLRHGVSATFLGRLVSRWLHRARRSEPAAARENIHHHYDIGNDFYRLWLDDQLVYTCAYFASPEQSLEDAQVAKFDHVCRKLELQPGQQVVEAGCGWGGLALHMARHYGVAVRAYNLSHEQIVYARARAEREGLSGRVEFVEDDWRNINGEYDVFVSVGMLEHVGRTNYRLLGDVIDGCLRPWGRGLIHSIGRNHPQPLDPWIRRRIFPGAYPPALGEMMEIFEANNFSVLDVENLRLHYAETLRQWMERYESAVPTIARMFDERFVRMWRLYLAGSIAAFEAGGLQLFQIVFARGDDNQVPWTREFLYRPEPTVVGRSADGNGSRT